MCFQGGGGGSQWILIKCIHYNSIFSDKIKFNETIVFSLDKDDDRDETDVDSEEEIEKERLKDLDERDQFAERLKVKDKEKQRSVISKSEKKVKPTYLTYWTQILCIFLFFNFELRYFLHAGRHSIINIYHCNYVKH